MSKNGLFNVSNSRILKHCYHLFSWLERVLFHIQWVLSGVFKSSNVPGMELSLCQSLHKQHNLLRSSEVSKKQWRPSSQLRFFRVQSLQETNLLFVCLQMSSIAVAETCLEGPWCLYSDDAKIQGQCKIISGVTHSIVTIVYNFVYSKSTVNLKSFSRFPPLHCIKIPPWVNFWVAVSQHQVASVTLQLPICASSECHSPPNSTLLHKKLQQLLSSLAEATEATENQQKIISNHSFMPGTMVPKTGCCFTSNFLISESAGAFEWLLKHFLWRKKSLTVTRTASERPRGQESCFIQFY